MPLATKNNALILKDGKVAENCNCCCICEDGYTKSLFATFSNWVVLPGTDGAQDIILGQTWELKRECGDKFWYYRGARSAPGRCQFSTCDLGYDLVILCGSDRGINSPLTFEFGTRPGNCKNAWANSVNTVSDLGRCISGSASFSLYDLCYREPRFARVCDVTVTWGDSTNPLP